MKRLITALVSGALAAVAAEAGTFSFVENGRAKPIRVPDDPALSTLTAADELAEYVRKMTGAAMPVVTGGTVRAGMVAIGTLDALGDGLPRAIADALAKATRKEASALGVADGAYWIVGRETAAELKGVYRQLERFGVRWFKAAVADDDGEYVPRTGTLAADGAVRIEEPYFEIRRLDLTGARSLPPPYLSQTCAFRNGFQVFGDARSKDRRVREFYEARVPRRIWSLGGQHLTFSRPLYPLDRTFREHPEYFALVNGRRTCAKLPMYCLSNPDLRRRVADHIIAQLDRSGGLGEYVFGCEDIATGWCECEACLKLDSSDNRGKMLPSVSTRFNKTVKAIAAMVYEKYPRADLRLWAYSQYREVPVGVDIDPRMLVWYCISNRCYGHGLDDPDCERNVARYDLLNRWRKASGNRVYFYDYLTCTPQYYTCNETTEPHDIRLYKRLGILGWKNEAPFSDAFFVPVRKEGFDRRTQRFPSCWQWLYVTAHMLWDPDLDEHALLDDVESKYYGAAYPAMREYQACRRKLWSGNRNHMGYPMDDQRRPSVLDAEGSKERLLGLLDRADALAAGDARLRSRLRLERQWLTDYWIAPNEVLRARRAHPISAPLVKDLDWSKACAIENFRPAGLKGEPVPAALKTSAKLLRDDDALYFRLSADLPQALGGLKLSTGRDSQVWADEEAFEIFLYPPTDENRYYQFSVNARGGLFDASHPPCRASDDYGASVEPKVREGGYDLTVRIPTGRFCALRAGDVWKVNIVRNHAVKDGILPKGTFCHAISLDATTHNDTANYWPVEIR